MIEILKELFEEVKNNQGKKIKVKELKSYKETLNKVIEEYNNLLEEIEKENPNLKGVFEKAKVPVDVYEYEDVFNNVPYLSKYLEKYSKLVFALDMLFEMKDLLMDEVNLPDQV